MERITNKMLQLRVDYLNRLTNNPAETYARDESGKLRAQIGNYHISGAYGGVSLEQICTPGGGVHNTFGCGHVPRRDLFNRLDAYIAGIDSKS